MLKVEQGKTRAARRTLYLTTESRRILAGRMEGDSPWIFPSERNPQKRITRLNNAHDRIGCNFVLYDLRHTFATRRAQSGFDLASLAAILGHSSLRMVQKYVHPTDEHQQALMRKYDDLLLAEERENSEGVAVN